MSGNVIHYVSDDNLSNDSLDESHIPAKKLILERMADTNFVIFQILIIIPMENFRNISSKVKLKKITLTCSFDVTAQKTISVKPCVGNIRKQIPPITLLSLMRARHLCFLNKVYQMMIYFLSQ